MTERFRIPWTTGKFEISQPESTIAPPADLLKRWEDAWFDEEEHPDFLLIQAFQAGADQELEACLEWLDKNLPGYDACKGSLRKARRPKPPSAKEQALFALAVLTSADETCSIAEIKQHWHSIRQALEQLDD